MTGAGERLGPRIGGIWPVAPHLRPQPRSPRGLCVVLTRQAPETGGGYDEDFVSTELADAMWIGGEA